MHNILKRMSIYLLLLMVVLLLSSCSSFTETTTQAVRYRLMPGQESVERVLEGRFRLTFTVEERAEGQFLVNTLTLEGTDPVTIWSGGTAREAAVSTNGYTLDISSAPEDRIYTVMPEALLETQLQPGQVMQSEMPWDDFHRMDPEGILKEGEAWVYAYFVFTDDRDALDKYQEYLYLPVTLQAD